MDKDRKPPEDPFTFAGGDIEALSRNIARAIEEGGKAMAAYLRPREDGRVKTGLTDEIADAVKTFGHLAEYWMKDPQRAVEAQSRLASGFMELWASSLKRMAGEPAAPAAAPDPRDPRFKAPEWSENQFFDVIKQAYLITTRWADKLVKDAEGLEPHMKHKADFYVRQLSAALSPSNFIATNPELIRQTLAENGENLVRGLHMLAEDIAAGQGDLKLRQSDASKFEVGVNLALTPGKVVFRNQTMELLQYAPATETVYQRPLLICPPWINKFYILDLNPEKSFIRWCVEQGLTVFVISWVNPGPEQRRKGFAEYMREGPLAALDEIRKITGETDVSAIGYCVGGTLLSVTLGWMAAQGDRRIASATLFATQVDFTHAGDLKVFVDEEQIQAVERKMAEHGYLAGSKMAAAFNMLRSQDLIWPYVVNNYVRGKQPFPFDLLYWNSDSTRMPEANHSFYLRYCYLENRLSRGRMEIDGAPVDLKKVTIPIYNLATREDHIAPPKSVFVGSAAFGGPVRYVLTGSGHIAGVINPPAKGKYQYWLGGPPEGAYEDWLAGAQEHPGSWWPDWLAWLTAQAPERIAAAKRKPGGRRKPLGEAPGSYVKIKA
ncbi:PHA/PHB synthase family protein [Labrys wisconsinensis]|uniref:Polyhydroxyalkanoate synthase n=1 Tax=Labrys wisconsinensis TaxID=425677 RepID=A0ABU0J334_9HYPH|nr:class I poly(R)-hydroxyalkanoic acid synthase [Labrys wisconsinensis]MDQ0468667.1 polyhydroxyalkanoate synthase [Labrys wisconsinensis]